jgi:hypothetical protein
VKSRLKGLFRNPQGVIRFARAFEPVNNHKHWNIAPFSRLPVALAENSRFRVHLEQPLFAGRQREPPRHVRRDDGHGVAISQERMRLKVYG